eukprot:m.116779 g.116779  ORF g.116779 m.116779 type:complete len:1394 (-) comp15411_c0_seq1:636-4817(-)
MDGTPAFFDQLCGVDPGHRIAAHSHDCSHPAQHELKLSKGLRALRLALTVGKAFRTKPTLSSTTPIFDRLKVRTKRRSSQQLWLLLDRHLSTAEPVLPSLSLIRSFAVPPRINDQLAPTYLSVLTGEDAFAAQQEARRKGARLSSVDLASTQIYPEKYHPLILTVQDRHILVIPKQPKSPYDCISCFVRKSESSTTYILELPEHTPAPCAACAYICHIFTNYSRLPCDQNLTDAAYRRRVEERRAAQTILPSDFSDSDDSELSDSEYSEDAQLEGDGSRHPTAPSLRKPTSTSSQPLSSSTRNDPDHLNPVDSSDSKRSSHLRLSASSSDQRAPKRNTRSSSTAKALAQPSSLTSAKRRSQPPASVATQQALHGRQISGSSLPTLETRQSSSPEPFSPAPDHISHPIQPLSQATSLLASPSLGRRRAPTIPWAQRHTRAEQVKDTPFDPDMMDRSLDTIVLQQRMDSGKPGHSERADPHTNNSNNNAPSKQGRQDKQRRQKTSPRGRQRQALSEEDATAIHPLPTASPKTARRALRGKVAAYSPARGEDTPRQRRKSGAPVSTDADAQALLQQRKAVLRFSYKDEVSLNRGWVIGNRHVYNPKRQTLQEWASGRAQMKLCRARYGVSYMDARNNTGPGISSNTVAMAEGATSTLLTPSTGHETTNLILPKLSPKRASPSKSTSHDHVFQLVLPTSPSKELQSHQQEASLVSQSSLLNSQTDRLTKKSAPYRRGLPRKRICVEQDYQNGNKFLRLNDGTGAAYYPSGRIAICTSLTAHGTYVWAFDDTDNGQLLASLSPLGGGACFKAGSNTPLLTTSVDGGCLFDDLGNITKEWSWGYSMCHVYQLNTYISLRITSKQDMSLTLRCADLPKRSQADLSFSLDGAFSNMSLQQPPSVKREMYELREESDLEFSRHDASTLSEGRSQGTATTMYGNASTIRFDQESEESVEGKLRSLLEALRNKSQEVTSSDTFPSLSTSPSTSKKKSLTTAARASTQGSAILRYISTSRLRMGRGAQSTAAMHELQDHEPSPDVTLSHEERPAKMKVLAVNVGCKLPKVFATRAAPILHTSTLIGLRTKADVLLAYLSTCVTQLKAAAERGEKLSRESITEALSRMTLDVQEAANQSKQLDATEVRFGNQPRTIVPPTSEGLGSSTKPWLSLPRSSTSAAGRGTRRDRKSKVDGKVGSVSSIPLAATLPLSWSPSPLETSLSSSGRAGKEPGLPLICPSAMAARLVDASSPYRPTCNCSKSSLPELLDPCFDKFLSEVPSNDLIVVGILRPGNMGSDRLQAAMTQLYRKSVEYNRFPCQFTKTGVTRFVRYTLPGLEENRLLQGRHNVTPGLVLVYFNSRLVFLNRTILGRAVTATRLAEQLLACRDAATNNQFLPRNFDARSL